MLGLNVTLNEQLEPPSSVLGLTGQLFVWLNCALTLIFDRVIGLDSLFVSVSVCAALVVPSAVLNESEVGEKSSGPIVAVPDRGSDCVRLGASSEMVKVLVRLPWASGRNCIETLQLAPAASVDGLNGHVEEATRKSDPAGTEIEEIVNAADWLLVTVNGFAPEVTPTCTAPHDKEAGERVTSCAAAHSGHSRNNPRNMNRGLAPCLVLNFRMASINPLKQT